MAVYHLPDLEANKRKYMNKEILLVPAILFTLWALGCKWWCRMDEFCNYDLLPKPGKFKVEILVKRLIFIGICISIIGGIYFYLN